MVKMRIFLVAAAATLLFPVSAAQSTILGPDAPKCASGDGPAILVRVSGLKSRAGKVRVRTFAGAQPKSWFDKKFALKRTEVDVPDAGSVDVCMPVPQAGGYVVDVRHDVNNNGSTDRADGAGASGNPNTSLFDFLLGKKPPASKVVVQVGEGVTTVPIVAKYLKGGSFQPVQVTAR